MFSNVCEIRLELSGCQISDEANPTMCLALRCIAQIPYIFTAVFILDYLD